MQASPIPSEKGSTDKEALFGKMRSFQYRISNFKNIRLNQFDGKHRLARHRDSVLREKQASCCPWQAIGLTVKDCVSVELSSGHWIFVEASAID